MKNVIKTTRRIVGDVVYGVGLVIGVAGLLVGGDSSTNDAFALINACNRVLKEDAKVVVL